MGASTTRLGMRTDPMVKGVDRESGLAAQTSLEAVAPTGEGSSPLPGSILRVVPPVDDLEPA